MAGDSQANGGFDGDMYNGDTSDVEHDPANGFNPQYDCHEVDWSDPYAPCGVESTKYKYVPTKWVGALFTALFTIVTVWHFVQAGMRWKKGGFMLLAGVCAIMEMAGWAARLKSASNPWNKGAFIAQMVLLILAPVFISAANYVNFEKLQEIVGHELSRLTPTVYFSIFLTGDILSLVIQAVGGGMAATAKTEKKLDRGTNIMIAGVSFQILVTLPFTLLFLDYHIRHYLKHKKEKLRYAHHLGGTNGEKGAAGSPWSKQMIRMSAASFFSTTMILIRCLYRMIEMIDGWHGMLATTEVYFVVLDATLIFLSVLVFNLVHPGTSFGPVTPSKPKQGKAAMHLNNGISHISHETAQNGGYPTYNQGHYAKGSDQVWNINAGANASYTQNAQPTGMYNLQTSSQTHVSHTQRHNGSDVNLASGGGAQQNYGGYAHRYQNSEVSLLGSNAGHQSRSNDGGAAYSQNRYQTYDNNLNHTNIYGGRYQQSEVNLVGSTPPGESPISAAAHQSPTRQASYNAGQGSANQWQYPSYNNSHVQQTQGSAGRRTPVGYNR